MRLLFFPLPSRGIGRSTYKPTAKVKFSVWVGSDLQPWANGKIYLEFGRPGRGFWPPSLCLFASFALEMMWQQSRVGIPSCSTQTCLNGMEICTSQTFYQTSKYSQDNKPELSKVRSQAPKHHRTCLKPQGVSQMFPLGTESLFHIQVETKRNIFFLKKKNLKIFHMNTGFQKIKNKI